MLDTSPHFPFPWNKGSNVHFLVDGDQFYPVILEAIKQAEKYILMEMYLFESGEVSGQFIKAFIQVARRGVSIQLLVDAYGGRGLLKKHRHQLAQAGIELVFYNPIMFRKFKKNLFRTHRKYIIIDGTKVFVGGAGITDDFHGDDAWRETVVEVQGSVVTDWQTLFIRNFGHWSNSLVPQPVAIKPVSSENVPARLAYTMGAGDLKLKRVC